MRVGTKEFSLTVQQLARREAQRDPSFAIKLACDARNACQRPLEAGVCGRVGAGAQEWRGHPLFAYAHENRAAVYAFVSMADKCVS